MFNSKTSSRKMFSRSFTAKLSLGSLFAALCVLPACSINANDKHNSKDGVAHVDIKSPMGDLHVSEQADIRDAGLTLYPGAKPAPKDDSDDKKSANVYLSFPGFSLKVVAAEFVPQSATDASAAMNVILSQNPDWIVVSGALDALSKSILDYLKLHGAENELAGARDSAVREVWKAYTDFKTALRKQESAAKLVTASQNAFDAVLESYKQGLSTYPEIISAQRNLASARSVSHDTQSAIFTAATALALSTGDLARPLVRSARPPHGAEIRQRPM